MCMCMCARVPCTDDWFAAVLLLGRAVDGSRSRVASHLVGLHQGGQKVTRHLSDHAQVWPCSLAIDPLKSVQRARCMTALLLRGDMATLLFCPLSMQPWPAGPKVAYDPNVVTLVLILLEQLMHLNSTIA
jgi:hypothetical protein